MCILNMIQQNMNKIFPFLFFWHWSKCFTFACHTCVLWAFYLWPWPMTIFKNTWIMLHMSISQYMYHVYYMFISQFCFICIFHMVISCNLYVVQCVHIDCLLIKDLILDTLTYSFTPLHNFFLFIHRFTYVMFRTIYELLIMK